MLGDPIFWIFVLPGLLLGAYAQSRIKINIAKYSQVSTQDGITAPKWRAGCSIRRAFATLQSSPLPGC